MTPHLMTLVDAYATAASMTLADPSTTRAEADRKARAAVVEALEKLTKDAERLDWVMHSVTGAAWRSVGVEYSAGCTREDIDAAIAAKKEQT